MAIEIEEANGIDQVIFAIIGGKPISVIRSLVEEFKATEEGAEFLSEVSDVAGNDMATLETEWPEMFKMFDSVAIMNEAVLRVCAALDSEQSSFIYFSSFAMLLSESNSEEQLWTNMEKFFSEMPVSFVTAEAMA